MGNQLLLGKDVHQLVVIFFGENEVVRFFNRDSALLCFPNATTAGAIHGAKKLLLGLLQVGAIRREELTLEPKRLPVVNCEIGI